MCQSQLMNSKCLKTAGFPMLFIELKQTENARGTALYFSSEYIHRAHCDIKHVALFFINNAAC